MRPLATVLITAVAVGAIVYPETVRHNPPARPVQVIAATSTTTAEPNADYLSRLAAAYTPTTTSTSTTTTTAKPIVRHTPPKPRPTTVHATSVATTVSTSGATVWDRIAACESGGNWHENTGNGYYGGLQMDIQFWRSYGGLAFAPRPDLANREQQITVAQRARDSGRGYHPWPVCGRGY